tara:strand:- start:217 stop:792 length:576 start_codon:yes stop_codon:yes gene_type:complete
MKSDLQAPSLGGQKSENFFEQTIKGSRKVSNYIVGGMLAIGGLGFLLASLSSYFGIDFLPLGQPSTLIFVPQGLIMGIYGLIASSLAIYFWRLIIIDFGSGLNRFDKDQGLLLLKRRGLFREINVEIPLKDIKAVKIEIREGINPLRRISLRIQGRKDLPISKVGAPQPLLDLEKEGAELARFLGVNLEGI